MSETDQFDDVPTTITFLHDYDDSEGSLFSYIHDAILEWDNEQNGRELSDTDAVLSIATAVWNEMLTRVPESHDSGSER